ncbi:MULTISPECIES: PLP-dependent aminotransferase family protein [Pseudomonas]|jgi:DNA-binding transcriptional MocR family regulator|uniref:PLP-dependent aminotransferase family protein n=1 Tax=Pseudomonas quebecensis TaxID=2995174 RepID=A0ABY6QN76_9PSED|nr:MULTISPECIES: PLP-dependent aminotransferase family protein [Pseudomonas]MCP1511342.1 DNA-binding transcriptional MocR family regulator [Pseudomonas rhodesiae]MCX4067648.1 PLP-dependent aminotransferase family protein [Pseudomonas quebecensis]MDF9770164.1 DNA-binding transcriptional MocR family regulator [Pseudomonas rhodesiae]UZW20777.1 PLP-dependent aminotransferase family protein [Pseudomonas quebecensis]UZW21805.1 PLP-dependent aminotransferase family protein [Pseudomonas quebecensis]
MPRARYKLLVDRFAQAIRSGAMAPGTRLPTHRQLAAEHGLALATASRVYTELEVMGLVSGETGRGTFVREIALPPGQGSGQMNVAAGLLDLNFNYPSLPGQADLLRTALRQLALSGDLEALLRYQPHAGRVHERAAVARHLLSRGLCVTAEQVLVVSGAQHGLAVTMMALLKPGDVIAVDALTYSGFKVLADTLHLEILALPANAHGPDLDALQALCRRRPVRAVYSMPTLHNPLGWVMDLAQRERLVHIAQQHNLMIIEDAAYAFLAEDAPPPVARLAPERTVYVGGLSKSVATGLRVGFVAAPPAWVKALERSVMATTWNVPGVMSAIAVGWLEDGTVAQLEAQKREDARARQALAAQVLKGLAYTAHPSSYFLWLPLAEDARADQVAMQLQRQGVSVSTAEPFAVSTHVPHALRLALGSVDMPALREALLKVRSAVMW